MESVNHIGQTIRPNAVAIRGDFLDTEMQDADLNRSFCANSDSFVHGLYVSVEDMPDEFYKYQEELFHERFCCDK